MRFFLTLCSAVTFAFAFTGRREIAAADAAPQKPNILLIVSDDQGWPDLGCMGLKPIQTPHLDRLAKEGVRLTNFYVTWPACTPSRSGLLTGRHPLRNGLYDMIRNDLVNYRHEYTEQEYSTSPEMTLGLDVRELTIGDHLQKAGYQCGMVGKWDMGQARRFLPLQRGFDFFYGHGNNGIDYYTHERYGIHSMFRGNERTKEDVGTYATDLFEREALRFLSSVRPAQVGSAGPAGLGDDVRREASAGQAASPTRAAGPNPAGPAGPTKPWFLYLCFNAPHGASSFGSDPDNPRSRPGVQAPEEYIAKYADTDLRDNLKRYYAAVTRMDDAIGKVLDYLEETGQSDNTLVVFHSDNGGSGNGGNAPLKGGKSTLWEGGLRVPFVARWPGKISPGRVSDEFLTTLELLPTFLAAAGAQPPEGLVLDGYDMLPTLAGKKPSPRKEMFWEFRGQKAARIGNFKWLESARGSGLFDLTSDVGEENDLSKAQPQRLAEIQSRWSAWRKGMDAAEPRGPFRDY